MPRPSLREAFAGRRLIRIGSAIRGTGPPDAGFGAARLLPGLGSTVRDHGGLGPALGRMGNLEVLFATTAQEIRLAQRLRYEVFYGERSAMPSKRRRLISSMCPPTLRAPCSER